MSSTRLIEVAFPLKQASLDSVHEKNVRHGHISTLHIWPARRPLAAARAALIATLLPDPGTPEARQKLVEKIGGVVKTRVKKVTKNGKTGEKLVEETEGGVLHWGREASPDLDWFRAEIRKAYGGRAPRVLDPFAGGGAIPLEAMRLGCEATAVDINPVAWFILKCTLQYPQKLAGQKRPLPDFALRDREFMAAYYKAQGLKGKKLEAQLDELELKQTSAPTLPGLQVSEVTQDADLAWHVRAWGRWVLGQARRALAQFYPTYADFEPLDPRVKVWARRETQLVPLTSDGTPDVDSLNAEFDETYLEDKKNPRWVAKPTVAYLWARTVTCKNCRATVPLLKTRWLRKTDRTRLLLTMQPNEDRTGVVFGLQMDVPLPTGTSAQRRKADLRSGAGTMTRSGATCPCCAAIMTMEDIRLEAQACRLAAVITAVVIEGSKSKEYRLPTAVEFACVTLASETLDHLYTTVPYGIPDEPTPIGGGSGAGRAFSVQGYGLRRWADLFNARQIAAIGKFVSEVRSSYVKSETSGYSHEWAQALHSYLAIAVDRLVDRSSTLCRPDPTPTQSGVINTFSRFALPITWDYIEGVPTASSSGSFLGAVEWVAKVVEQMVGLVGRPEPKVLQASILEGPPSTADIIVTDPPYYDAIPYSDLMDFFYVWLRRTLHGIDDYTDNTFRQPLSPKWDHTKEDGELIDDDSRHGGDRSQSRAAYENGMARAFAVCHEALAADGRLVIVFAHKHPDAWETLVSAIIRAGFVVNGSWPIQTEMGNRTRALSSAALSSSVWLVCKKRQEAARPGWDNRVLDEMRSNINAKLRDYWDAGIRGPDFVWAATGPALEAYSRHPVVKKANEPGQVMTVSEFLRHVRRIVVDFVVGRVLFREGEAEAATGLDDVTTYYLLHRHDFGLEDAPIGACILYAVSCGLSDQALVDQFDLLARTGGQAEPDDTEADDEEGAEGEDEAQAETEEGTGSVVRLKPWNKRTRKGMGYDPAVDSPRAKAQALQPALMPEMELPLPRSRAVPLIDQVHRLMHLWKAGDVVKVNDYVDDRALQRNALFHKLLQALIELAAAGSEERSFLESLSNHMASQGVAAERPMALPGLGE